MLFYSSKTWVSRCSPPIPSFVSQLFKASTSPSSSLTWPVGQVLIFKVFGCLNFSKHLAVTLRLPGMCFGMTFSCKSLSCVGLERESLTSTCSVCLSAGRSLLGHKKGTFSIKKVICCIVTPILSHGNGLRNTWLFTEKHCFQIWCSLISISIGWPFSHTSSFYPFLLEFRSKKKKAIWQSWKIRRGLEIIEKRLQLDKGLFLT